MKQALKEIAKFIQGVFSDNGNPSSSRVLTAILCLGTLVGVLYVVFHTGHLPPGSDTIGAAGFATAPYGVNSAMNCIKRPSQQGIGQEVKSIIGDIKG